MPTVVTGVKLMNELFGLVNAIDMFVEAPGSKVPDASIVIYGLPLRMPVLFVMVTPVVISVRTT